MLLRCSPHQPLPFQESKGRLRGALPAILTHMNDASIHGWDGSVADGAATGLRQSFMMNWKTGPHGGQHRIGLFAHTSPLIAKSARYGRIAAFGKSRLAFGALLISRLLPAQ
jgi:hypothetical protein